MDLFRVMLKAPNGAPVGGGGANMLGVRVGIDVRPDATGNVERGRGGLSVAPEDPARLPPHLRPVRFGGACGLPLFAIGADDLGPKLDYLPDAGRPGRHGTIEPARGMPVANYQAALADTAPRWKELA
jgi:hypothetical protein